MPKRQTMGVDDACIDLAKHFLADASGATEEDLRELAEALQRTAEGFCSSLIGEGTGHAH
jgi:hypothetical protein